MKNIEINGVTYTEIIAIYGNETEAQDALLIHDTKDTYCDGDAVICGYSLPETKEDANDILNDTALTTYFTIENGIYRINE